MADDGGGGNGEGGSERGEPFDFEDWKRRLYELNPWAEGLPILRETVSFPTKTFEQARKTASAKRWADGRKVWNAWARDMLALKEEAARDHDAYQLHRQLAKADLSGLSLRDDADFTGYVFPGFADFCDTILGEQEKSSGRVMFTYASFCDAAFFNRAQFNGYADFQEAQFEGNVEFLAAQFVGGSAHFDAARFGGRYVDFGGVRFSGGDAVFVEVQFNCKVEFAEACFSGGFADFHRAQFSGDVVFEGTVFFKEANFGEAQFSSQKNRRVKVVFGKCNFQGPAVFEDAKFQDANFTSIISERSFSMTGAEFETTPSFIEAKFHKPPRLDNIVIKTQPAKEIPEQDPRPWWAKRFLVAPDKDEHARFRELRAMAADGNDHVNALRFNAREIIARRFWVDKPYPLEEEDTWENCHAARYWLGWLYGVFSDYGRSIVRPLMWEVGLVGFFAVVFLTLAVAEEGPRPGERWNACHASYLGDEQKKNQKTNRLTEAIALSKRNVLFIGRADTARRTYGCLYGLENEGRSGRVPPWVGFLSSAQSILSAILLFLAGLAIRNMFRIG